MRPSLPLLSHKLPPSSKSWLARQFRDPLVRQRLSHPASFRSRSAFKLLDLDEKWKFLKHADVRNVVDLGAAPGGWSQVLAGKFGWTAGDVVGSRGIGGSASLGKKTKQESVGERDGFGLKSKKRAEKYGSWSTPVPDADDPLDILYGNEDHDIPPLVGRANIVAVDLLPIFPIPGVKTVKMNFLSAEADSFIGELLAPTEGSQDEPGKADIILSDMAANFSGNHVHDIESCMDICNAVFEFTTRHMRKAEEIGRKRGGVLILKHFAHPLTQNFREEFLEPNFHFVTTSKPESSRSESSETYWVCMGWSPYDRAAHQAKVMPIPTV